MEGDSSSFGEKHRPQAGERREHGEGIRAGPAPGFPELGTEAGAGRKRDRLVLLWDQKPGLPSSSYTTLPPSMRRPSNGSASSDPTG